LAAFVDPKNNIPPSVCTNLYDKEVLKGMEFIPGIYYEDMVFYLMLFPKLDKIGFIDVALYYYFQSPVSTIRSNFSERKIRDYVRGMRIVSDNLKGTEDLALIREKYFPGVVKTMFKYVKRAKKQDDYKELRRCLRTEVLSLKHDNIIGYQGLRLRHKLVLWYWENF